MAGNSEDFDKTLKFGVCCNWERIFHVESRAAGCDQMYLDGKDVVGCREGFDSWVRGLGKRLVSVR